MSRNPASQAAQTTMGARVRASGLDRVVRRPGTHDEVPSDLDAREDQSRLGVEQGSGRS
jgi:hypothetical protein